MRKISRCLLMVAIILLAACQHSLTSYVNPLIGTGGHGHTFPGATLPFGSVQVSPDNMLDGWDGCSGYHYDSDTIYGFSHTHLSGTGCSDYGDLLLMPFAAEGEAPEMLDYNYYKSAFKHNNEMASPGYYNVVLDRGRIMVELTVHEISALHQYTYPHVGSKGFVIDLSHRDVVVNSLLHTRTIKLRDSTIHTLICGQRTSAAWNPDQHLFFAIALNCDIESIAYYNNGKLSSNKECITGTDCKAMVYLPDGKKEVCLTVALSAVDEEGAVNNLRKSLDISFSKARKEAEMTWNKALAQFEVEGGSKENRTAFYTALYHCMTAPNRYSDADGRYRTMKDSAGNYHIGQLSSEEQNYTVFSLWDTYRTLHPLLNISDPERSADFVMTFLRHYQQNGELTMWELAGHETHCMIGYHAASVIRDAYRTGVLDNLDVDQLNELLDAMVATSNLPMLGRTEYGRDGYLSSEFENESVSKTLEYAYDDWCIAQMANDIKKLMEQCYPDTNTDYQTQIYQQYMRRSQSWKNIMDADGFMHARRNGGFTTPFNPTEVNNHFTEANSWQYSSYVPHDVEGWIAQMGGEKVAERFLDSLFYGKATLSGRDQSDITGLIGQYAHGNEPSHHAAYLYAYLGQQYKSAALVRQICNELYTDAPDGLCGNEDCGQMSAWLVMSAMGFYPVCPGSGEYVIGSPLFDKVTLHLKNGKDIVINAKGQKHSSCYVQSLRLNGLPYDKAFITIEQLKDGCVLDFEMGSQPNTQWGAAAEARPHSGTPKALRITPAPVFSDWQQRFSDSVSISIMAVDSIFYTLDGSMPTTASLRYEGPITVSSDVVLKAMAYNESTGRSSVVTHQRTQLQQDRTLTYITKPDPQYFESGEIGLIDNLHGTTNFRIGGWQGWQGDCEVVVDLLEPRVVSLVGAECLESMRAWIFFPREVIVSVSDDGSSYRPFGSIVNDSYPATLQRQDSNTIHNFVVAAPATTARYVRIRVVNYGKLPQWHVSAGQQCWTFVDEITVQ